MLQTVGSQKLQIIIIEYQSRNILLMKFQVLSEKSTQCRGKVATI